MKIAIIGNPGSGKSTLGLKLHTMLNTPLYHIDQYFWKPNWQERDRGEFEKIHHNLCDQNEWIIEGMATRLFEYRIQHADIIIFLDIPTYRCLCRVCKRAISNWGKVYFSSAKDCPERGPSLRFLKYILTFNSDKKPVIEHLLKKYHDQKKIFVVKNNAELQALIKKFATNVI